MDREVNPQERYEAYRNVFGTEEGQVVLADLLLNFGFTQRSLVGENPHMTYFNEGSRSVLAHIQRRVSSPPPSKEIPL